MTKTILVLGSGPNIGLSVLKLFKFKGYKTAAIARNPSSEFSSLCDVVLKADFADPSCIEGIFAQVKNKIGTPNVVVYNAYAFPRDPATSQPIPPFSVPLKQFTETMNTNLSTPYVAIQQAIAGFESLPKEVLKTFIFTGNAAGAAPHLVWPPYMQLSLGKRGGAVMIECASRLYKDAGYRFYWPDERMADATPMYKDLSGEAHAELYLKLATQPETEPWCQTFVKGQGYVDFKGRVGEVPKRRNAADEVKE